MSKRLLTIDKLSVTFGGLDALRELDFHVTSKKEAGDGPPIIPNMPWRSLDDPSSRRLIRGPT